MKLVELNDVDGTKRYVNVDHIAFLEKHGEKCRVVLAMPGRADYNFYAFLAEESYEEAKAIVEG